MATPGRDSYQMYHLRHCLLRSNELYGHDSKEKVSYGPVTISGIRQPPTRAFMDDMMITAKSVPEGRWIMEDGPRMPDLKVKDEV